MRKLPDAPRVAAVEGRMIRVQATRHVLAVKDTGASARHYIDVLGFSRDFALDGWEFLSLDEFRIMLGQCPDEVAASATNNHSYFAHVLVNDVDVLHDDMRSRGATFFQEVRNQPWGLREFGVVTPDGHRMVFGQTVE